MSGDRLAQIKARAHDFHATVWLGDGEPAGILYERASELADDVRALVEIANAARVVMQEVETDLPQRCLICARPEYDHVDGCPVPPLRSALARLDSGAAE